MQETRTIYPLEAGPRFKFEAGNPVLMLKSLNQFTPVIREMLESYHFAKRERIESLQIDPAFMVSPDGSMVTFAAYYQIGMFNACADLNHTASEKMQFTLQYDKAGELFILTGENWPERGPDEF